MNKKKLITIQILLISLGAILLTACSVPDSGQEGVNPETPSAQIAEQTETPAVEPTALPNTPSPPLAVLLTGPGADPELQGKIERQVAKTANHFGLAFEVYGALPVNDLPPNLILVVALPEAQGLPDLISASPGTQFVTVNVAGLPSSPNLTVVNIVQSSPSFEGFIAGYAAVVTAAEYRIGGLAVDNARGKLIRQSYINGVRHFCGLCRPENPPYEYPKFLLVTKAASLAEKKEQAERLIGDGVRVIYLGPGVGEEGLYDYLVQERGLLVVGADTPPDSAKPGWILTVQQTIFPDIGLVLQQVLQEGSQGVVRISTLEITNANETIISQARVEFILKILGKLEQGIIDPVGD